MSPVRMMSPPPGPLIYFSTPVVTSDLVRIVSLGEPSNPAEITTEPRSYQKTGHEQAPQSLYIHPERDLSAKEGALLI